MWSSHGRPQWKCFSGLQLIARAISLHRGHLWRVSTVSGEGNGTPPQSSCLENPMDGGAWWAAVHGVARSRTWLSDLTFAFHFHALEKETATHPSILAWRTPGMAEPGGLPSVGYGVAQSWTRLKRLSNRSSAVSVTASRHPSRIWFTYLEKYFMNERSTLTTSLSSTTVSHAARVVDAVINHPDGSSASKDFILSRQELPRLADLLSAVSPF